MSNFYSKRQTLIWRESKDEIIVLVEESYFAIWWTPASAESSDRAHQTKVVAFQHLCARQKCDYVGFRKEQGVMLENSWVNRMLKLKWLLLDYQHQAKVWKLNRKRDWALWLFFNILNRRDQFSMQRDSYCLGLWIIIMRSLSLCQNEARIRMKRKKC